MLFSYERISPLNELFPISTSRITTKTVSSVPGGVVGSALGYATSSNFKSVIQVVQEMPEKQKQALMDAFGKVFSNLEVTDLASLKYLIASDVAVKTLLVRQLKEFLKTECQLELTEGN